MWDKWEGWVEGPPWCSLVVVLEPVGHQNTYHNKECLTMSDNFVRPSVCPSVTDKGSLLLEQFFLWFKKEGGGGRSWQIIKFRSRNSHIRPAGYSLLCLVIHTSSLNIIHKVRIYQFQLSLFWTSSGVYPFFACIQILASDIGMILPCVRVICFANLLKIGRLCSRAPRVGRTHYYARDTRGRRSGTGVNSFI